MAYPKSLGHVMSFSRNELMLFTGDGMIASNGYEENEMKTKRKNKISLVREN